MTSILVVDDDRAFLEGIAWLLRAEDYSIICACSLEEAQTAIAENRIDLAIVDVKLRNDGESEQVVATLREHMVLFGRATGSGVEAIPKADRGEFVLEKPFEAQALFDCVQSALSREGRKRA